METDLKIAFKEHAFPLAAMLRDVTDGPARLTAASPVVVVVDETSGHFERQVSRYALQHGAAVLR